MNLNLTPEQAEALRDDLMEVLHHRDGEIAATSSGVIRAALLRRRDYTSELIRKLSEV